jgi:hypothetical protein
MKIRLDDFKDLSKSRILGLPAMFCLVFWLGDSSEGSMRFGGSCDNDWGGFCLEHQQLATGPFKTLRDATKAAHVFQGLATVWS